MLLFLKSKRKAVNLLKKSKFEVQFNFCQRLTVHGRQPSRGMTGFSINTSYLVLGTLSCGLSTVNC